MLSGETTNANCIVFSLTRSGLEPTIYHTRSIFRNCSGGIFPIILSWISNWCPDLGDVYQCSDYMADKHAISLLIRGPLPIGGLSSCKMKSNGRYKRLDFSLLPNSPVHFQWSVNKSHYPDCPISMYYIIIIVLLLTYMTLDVQ